MEKKQIIGVVLVSLGFGALAYLYVGYIKPKSDALKQIQKK